MSNTSDLPLGDPSNFVGEFETMDLSPLYGKSFGVAVSNGPRDGTKFVSSTLLAPLDFYQMVEAVKAMFVKHMLHTKVFILNQDLNSKMQYIDECTIDYIEANCDDILMDAFLTGELSEGKEYTCRAGFYDAPEEE